MPWNVPKNPKIEQTVKADSENLPLESTRCDDAERAQVASLSAKKFRRLLRNRTGDRSVLPFQVVQVNAMKMHSKVKTKD